MYLIHVIQWGHVHNMQDYRVVNESKKSLRLLLRDEINHDEIQPKLTFLNTTFAFLNHNLDKSHKNHKKSF